MHTYTSLYKNKRLFAEVFKITVCAGGPCHQASAVRYVSAYWVCVESVQTKQN